MGIQRALWRASVLLAVCTLAVAGCGENHLKPQAGPSTSAKPMAPPAEIHGDTSDPVNKIVAQAIGDIQAYWQDEFPKLYETDYTPVKGGFYAVYPSKGALPPCAESADDIAGNAFYCAKADDVAWDAEGLLPSLRKRFGDFVIPVVLAHEWGHAIQARANFQGETVTKEIQADCFAGAWAAHAKDTFNPSADDMDNALAGFLFLRDEPGTAKHDLSAHGSGFDRVNSFRTGFDKGPKACAAYRNGDPVVVELPFNNAADQASGGDAPYDAIIEGVPADLEDYFTQLIPELTGGKYDWTPLAAPRKIDPDKAPDCGGKSMKGSVLYYCVDDDYVGFDNVKTMPEIYDSGGDFSVATLIATQYGLAALMRMGQPQDSKQTSLRADCLAGSWAASILLHNRPNSRYSLSPGDLDKAVAALLLYRTDNNDVAHHGQGAERVDAYRRGVYDGAKPCLTL
ncbi:neutral zinc metallopeptidase [Mycolicibacterium sp. CBMA 226]|uniref:neutral zinc metallopeptidase n=1 Tax=Mycolicibacterium sp. CBMA 226 TaxID=2606611 RepID=UPI0012DF4A7C|nr:neutral zinc metallopeptidase [Mycolicibacterium sp. CBMA 226]MUL75974.1 peptidase [Mycolicibacterium sp. CBMA 226]